MGEEEGMVDGWTFVGEISKHENIKTKINYDLLTKFERD
jgi:hypothetical protein